MTAPLTRERERLAACGDLERVPLAGRLDPLVLDLPSQIEKLVFAVGGRSSCRRGTRHWHRRIGPGARCPVAGIANVGAAVVALSAIDLRIAELEVEDGVAVLLLGQQHIVPAVTVADEEFLFGVDVPLSTTQFTLGWHGHAIPAIQIRGGMISIQPCGIRVRRRCRSFVAVAFKAKLQFIRPVRGPVGMEAGAEALGGGAADGKLHLGTARLVVHAETELDAACPHHEAA